VCYKCPIVENNNQNNADSMHCKSFRMSLLEWNC
jgi:hypothetical protein